MSPKASQYTSSKHGASFAAASFSSYSRLGAKFPVPSPRRLQLRVRRVLLEKVWPV